MTNPNTNPNGTDSVSQEQAFKDWTAAGNGVPLQYKGREHVWDRKVDNMKKGGEVHMGAGGLLGKVMKGAQKILPVVERDANLARMLEGSAVKERVYHGSGNLENLQSFDPSMTGRGTDQLGSGFYFSTHPDEASGYATSVTPNVTSGTPKLGGSSSPGVVPAYLSLKKPINIKGSSLSDADVKLSQKHALEMLRRAPNIRHPEDTPLHDWFDLSRTGGVTDSMLRDVAKNYQGASLNSLSNDFYRNNPTEFRHALRDVTGHDSVVQDFGDGRKHYVAWFPEQIKSATGNRGTYDLTNPDVNKATGGSVHMADGGAAFGKFPQMKPRRSKQDREASKNVPVDLARGFTAGALGAPGDIESLIRMLPGLDEQTYLPTSEEIEKRLPFRSESPVSKAATGMGSLAGGFYTGPGAPIRVVGALPGALKHGAQEFAKASVAGVPHVIKPKGGNWLAGRVEKDVAPLRRRVTTEAIQEGRYTPEQSARLAANPQTKANDALNKWVDSNLSNYIKKEMGTPEDPLRKLAEEGVTHNKGLLDFQNAYADSDLMRQRKEAGFPEQGMAQSPLARAWERAADESIAPYNAGEIQGMPDKIARMQAAESKMKEARDALYHKFREHMRSKGVSEDEANMLARETPHDVKARVVGDTDFARANVDYLAERSPMMESFMNMNKENPWIGKVDPESSVYSSFTHDLGFDHIMDVLREDLTAGRIRPEQLSKVSMTDAVRRAHQYDQDLAAKMNEARMSAREGLPVHKEYPEGYRWVELNRPGSFANESEAMGHSVRGYEPPVGHPDWVEGSGEMGSLGYGHGGWEAIKSGKAKVYSLVNPKGEPHVTVETKSGRPWNERSGIFYDNPELEPSWAEYSKNVNQEARAKGVDRPANYILGYPEWLMKNDPETFAKHQKVFEPAPQSISQIKGKQNRAPNEEYLPYVQDFVKGGQWSDVGDLSNTGLYSAKDVQNIMPESFTMSRNARQLAVGRARQAKDLPDYMTRAEYEAMLQKHAPEDIWAAEKAQRAAEDDQLLRELRPPEEPHMAGGGLLKAGIRALMEEAPRGVEPIVVKAAERAAAGKKAAELIKSQPQVKASEALGQAMEKGFKKTTTTQADRTRVGGGNIGGAAFPAISEAHPEYAGKVWGVMDEGTASRLKNLTDPETAWTTMLGSEHQLKTNPIVFDKLKRGFMDSMKAGNLSPELEAKINHNLALKFGKGADIRDPSIWKQADTFDKRAALADLMMGQGIPPGKGGVALGGEKSGRGVIFKPTDILKQETERGLLHPEHGGEVDTFAAGPRLFSMEPESMYRPDLHPGFPTLISGKDLGVNMMPTPTEVYLPDWHRKFKADNPNRKAPGYYDLALGVKGQGLPSQEINDEFIRHLLREGYKAGGAVGGLSAATKSCSCHD